MAISCIFASGAEEPAAAGVQTLFRSLGTDATGTLNAWTTDAGIPAIAANVVTLPAGARIHSGHLDWSDCTVQVRFNRGAGAGSQPTLYSHYVDSNNHVFFYNDGTSSVLSQVIGGVNTTLGVDFHGTAASTWYWFQITWVGGTVTAKIFNDNAGAINLASQFGVTLSAAASPATGAVGLQATTQASTFGGAFANVCQVTGPAPTGWITNSSWTTKEPAFCWSKVSPYAGSYSFSIYSPVAITNVSWSQSAPIVIPVGANTYSFAARIVGTAALEFSDFVSFTAQINGPTTGWQTAAATGGNGGSLAFALNVTTASTGFTAYWDNVAVYRGTLPLQPTILRTGGSGGRSIAKFGGAALPNGQGIMQAIDLNDYVNTLLVDYLRSDDSNRQLGLEQLLYRARSTYVSDDFGPRPISLPMIYQDDATHFIGGFLAALSQAGEQQLTFDNLTYIAVKYKGITGRLPARARQPLAWSFSLELLAAEPWFKDLIASTMAALTLTVDAGQPFGVLYPGSVRCDDAIWTLVVPASNGVAINSMQLINTITGEALTVNFLSYAAIPATTAKVITIDTGQSTAVDDAGHAYDVSGSFPKLHPPAGMVNPFNVIMTPASGATSGLTLACSYANRWQI